MLIPCDEVNILNTFRVMIILRLLLLLTNLHLKLLSTQGTIADKLLSTQRVNMAIIIGQSSKPIGLLVSRASETHCRPAKIDFGWPDWPAREEVKHDPCNGSMHFIYYINRSEATKVDSTYLGYCPTAHSLYVLVW